MEQFRLQFQDARLRHGNARDLFQSRAEPLQLLTRYVDVRTKTGQKPHAD
jgi:hypothetical protein